MDVRDVRVLSGSDRMVFGMTTFRACDAGPAYVPAEWPHRRGPLHHLLAFQSYRCAVCARVFTWEPGSGLEPRQWVVDGLLWALTCYGCSVRHTRTTSPATASDASPEIVERLRQIAASPPAQQCPATAGLGRQRPPRSFRARLAPVESPTEAWSYYGTVIHSLLLFQRGRCQICSTGLSVTSRPKVVHVDHDKSTGLIRGILCNRCNIALEKRYPDSWWEHALAFKNLYLAQPPAQTFPATQRLTYSRRWQKARRSPSGDGTEVLLDDLPVSIGHQHDLAADVWQPPPR